MWVSLLDLLLHSYLVLLHFLSVYKNTVLIIAMVMFYKVPTNSELVNIDPLPLREIRVVLLRVSGHIFIN